MEVPAQVENASPVLCSAATREHAALGVEPQRGSGAWIYQDDL
jgi:hypothetical protein